MFILEIIIAGILGLFGFSRLLNSKERVDKEVSSGVFNTRPKRVGWIALIGSVAGFFSFKKKRLTTMQKIQKSVSEVRLPFQKPKKKSLWHRISGK